MFKLKEHSNISAKAGKGLKGLISISVDSFWGKLAAFSFAAGSAASFPESMVALINPAHFN
jgi:hypothetical protein